MPSVNLPDKDPVASSYNPRGNEKDFGERVFKRIDELKEHRKSKLAGLSKSVEDVFREADQEYQPHELILEKGKRLESNDETGLRSRLVKVGSADDWQSNMAAPDFYVKVNTALSILVDQNPEAVFIASNRKYQAVTRLAYGLWKNSWEVSGAKQQLKNFIFNMAKYGVGYMRTYPKKITLDKKIRKEYYPDQPDKDVYEDKKITKFNDLCRESLNAWQVWTSEMTRPGDYQSMDDWYYEKDFSWDRFQSEFKEYKNIVSVAKGANTGHEGEDVDEKHPDTVTVGFYENQVLDLYGIVIPSSKVVLYYSPLPNDEGMLSLTTAPWSLRSDLTIYGIGLWEIIRNDSVLYDRLLNMTMDQLVLAIYKMFFYKGVEVLGENGELNVSPGHGEQVMDPKAIQFLEVPGPGAEAWKGLDFLQMRKDQTSGVTPQLMANFGGKTLGQDMQAKEAALERMKTPLDYILDALQQEAYITLSWQKQILSTPEVVEFTSPENLTDALLEMGLTAEEIKAYLVDLDTNNPKSELLFQQTPEEEGQQPRKFANVYKEQSLNLEQDEEGELIESKEQRFFRFGIDLPTHKLDWRGMIRIKPQSVLAPSKELTRRMKLDLFNLVIPAIQGMLAQPMFIPILSLPIKQIIKVYEEDERDWMAEDELMKLYQAASQPVEPPPEPPKMSFSVKLETLTPDVQKQILEKYAGIKIEEPLFIGPEGAVPEVSSVPLAGGEAMPPDEEAPVEPDFQPLVNRASVGGGQTMGGGAPPDIQIA